MMSELFTPRPSYVRVPFDLLSWYSHSCPNALSGSCEGWRCYRRAALIALGNGEIASARRFLSISKRLRRSERCGV